MAIITLLVNGHKTLFQYQKFTPKVTFMSTFHHNGTDHETSSFHQFFNRGTCRHTLTSEGDFSCKNRAGALSQEGSKKGFVFIAFSSELRVSCNAMSLFDCFLQTQAES